MIAPGLLLLLALSEPSAFVLAGDEAFFRMEYRAAVSSYEQALGLSPESPDVFWRLARTYVCMGEVEEGERGRELFRTAEVYARRCVALDPERGEGHTWLAGALGYLALDAGPGDQAALVREVEAETGRALACNPRDDAAYSIRGSMFRALGNVGWIGRQLASLLLGGLPEGGFAEAEGALSRAIELAPDIMRHHYELGVLYLDWGRREEARRVLLHARTLPVRVAIDRDRVQKIRTLLGEPGETP